jgi:hypothetical protein
LTTQLIVTSFDFDREQPFIHHTKQEQFLRPFQHYGIAV